MLSPPGPTLAVSLLCHLTLERSVVKTVLTSTNLTFGLLGANSVLGEMPPLSKINNPLHPSD